MRAKKPEPPGLLLRCGCEIRFRDGEAPICPTHGNQPVARVLRMPPPRIRGVASGPHVTTCDLPAFVQQIVVASPVPVSDGPKKGAN